MKTIETALTFDDLLLVPKRFRGTSRSDISTSTSFTKKISLNIPIVSSNMDTVTESEMAIVMARSGGIGVIHSFLPIEKQDKLIKQVKTAQNYIIEKPYTLPISATIEDVRNIMDQFHVSGILITGKNDTLQGIITNRDLRFTESNGSDSVQKHMTARDSMVVGNDSMSLEEAKAILKEKKVEKLPLVDKTNKITGLITGVDIERSEQAPKATKDRKGRLMVSAAIGVKSDAKERAEALINADVDALVIDIAHGHSDLAINAV